MATPSDHSKIVLAAILHNRRDLLEKSLSLLTQEHFPEKVHARIFGMLERYSDFTDGAVMPLKFLDDRLRGRADPGQIQLYTETYEALAEFAVDDAEFAWSVQQLREHAAEEATGTILTEGMEILRKGKTVDDEVLVGSEAARIHILERFQEIDRELIRQDAPEGALQDEEDEMLADYAERKRARELGTSIGVRFGIEELDRKIGGLQPAELVLTAGYSSDGKSSLCVQLAWNAAVEQGKNVAFLTTETLRPQIRRKLISRHSKQPQFELPEGLNNRDIKAGSLLAAQERAYAEVVRDLSKNPGYGKLYVAQVPRASGIASIEQRLYRIQRRFNIDLVVMDYLGLLISERRRQTQREELASILKDAKVLATTFDNSRGVPFVSPWQVTRAAREAAENLGAYSSASLSETAEATNSPDVVVSLLAPTDNTDRHADLTMQVLKNRDGETANGIMVAVDYATCHFRSKRMTVEDFTRGSGFSASDDMSSLLPS